MTVTLRKTIDAVCQRIHDAGIAYWPGPDGEYPHNLQTPPVFAKRLPSQPDAAVAVNAYQRSESVDPANPIVQISVQVRVRAPYDADPTADLILGALHGQHHQEWAGVPIERVSHESTAQLGADSMGLDERTDNYTVTVLNH